MIARFSLRTFSMTEMVQVMTTLSALIIFTLGNHLLVGKAIRLNRRPGLRNSGVFSHQTLTMDFGLLCLGAGAAFIWSMNPFAVAFLFVVVYLLHSVLRVPSLEREAYRDPKTGLYNAEYLNNRLKKAVPRTRPSRSPALRGNGGLGSPPRDQQHVRAYGRRRSDQESGTNPASAGPRHRHRGALRGEEFTVLMPDTTKGEAVIQAEAMRKAIEAAEFTVAHDTMPSKITVGPRHHGMRKASPSVWKDSPSADLAMYEAKEAGRNQCCIYDSWTPDNVPQDSQWSTPVEVNRTMSKHPKANTTDTRPSSSGGWQGDPTDRGVPKRRSAPAFEIVRPSLALSAS